MIGTIAIGTAAALLIKGLFFSNEDSSQSTSSNDSPYIPPYYPPLTQPTTRQPRINNTGRTARRAPMRMDPAYEAIAERDTALRRFMVRSTEGEVCSVDTSDRGSIFYGPAWTRILGAYESGEFIRGVVKCPMHSKANGQLSGYIVNISGVDSFMPISKSAWFRTPEHDPVGKCIAVKVTAVYPGGAKAGTVTVDAWEPWKTVLKLKPSGNTVLRLAMDHDGSDLIFPLYRMETVRAPLSSALNAARAAGLKCGVGLLTGHIWQLRTHGRDNTCEVISCLKD